MTTEETLIQIRELARQLPPEAKLRVIRDMTEQLLTTSTSPSDAAAAHLRPGEDPWDALRRIGSELGPPAPGQASALEDLTTSRR
jgi:hypothetical protein